MAAAEATGENGRYGFTTAELQELLAQVDESSAPGHLRASFARLIEDYGRAQRALEAAATRESDAQRASERQSMVKAADLTPERWRWEPRRLLLRWCIEIVLVVLVAPVFVVLVAPVFIFLALLPLGSLLAWMEGWEWHTGCFYIVSVVCGLAQPLGSANDVDPLTTLARAACSVAGLWSIGLTGAIAAVAGAHSESARLLKAVCRNLVARCCCTLPDAAAHASFLPFLACALLLSPLLILATVLLFALLMLWVDFGASRGVNTTVDSTIFYYLANVAWIPTSHSASTGATSTSPSCCTSSPAPASAPRRSSFPMICRP
jgi:hypothetical protein